MKHQHHRIAMFCSSMALLMTQPASAFDPDALNTLKKSVSEWNAMRLEKPEQNIDLYKAQLENIHE